MSKFKGVLDAVKSTRPASSTTPRGRPRAKRSDPEYRQTTAYIRKDTHHAAKVALLQEGKGREFSELIEELLADWLNRSKPRR